MLGSDRMDALRASLKAAEDLSTVSTTNIANADTLGYRALIGVIAPDCKCECFSDLIPEVTKRAYPGYPVGRMHVELTQSDKSAGKVTVNGITYEKSNVNAVAELQKLVQAAAMAKTALAALQLESRTQREIINLASNR